jgi:hypothetical protein
MANKLATARSMPEMTTVYQDWLSQRMQRYVDDSKSCVRRRAEILPNQRTDGANRQRRCRLNRPLPAARS